MWFDRHGPRALLGATAAVLAGVGLLVAAYAPALTQTIPSRERPPFHAIAAVLQHPRCLNCHQPLTPLQGDAAKPHIPRVVRGADGQGVSAMRCGNCHRDSNNSDSGVPGTPHWQLAPRSMSWSGLSVAELCRALKDPKRNGNRSLQALVKHMAEDKLVLWGWEPGENRMPVPLSHKEFVDLLDVWVRSGGSCPS